MRASTDREHRIIRNRMRRRKQLRNRLIFGILSVFAILFFSIGLFTLKANAQGHDAPQEFKYYRSIAVHTGDRIEDYADVYAPGRDVSSYVREVMRMNQLREEEITAGMFLIVPYYSTEFLE